MDSFIFNSSESGSGELPDDNATFRCNLPPFLPPSLGIPNVINLLQAVIAITTAMVGLPLNAYLLVIILKNKVLHQLSPFLSLQIIIVEIVYQAVIPVLVLTSGITGTWVFGEVLCNIAGIIHDGFPAFRCSMTLVWTIDRFIYVFSPNYYSKHGEKLAWFLSGCVWVFSLVRVLVPLYGVLDCYTYIPTFKTCTTFSGCSKSCENFVASSITLIVSTGVILPLVLYIIIFVKLKQVMGQHNNSQKNIEPSIVRLRRRNKILITVFLLVISLIGGTTPSTIGYVISLFHRVISVPIFIFNMLVGRTFFNLIPVFDALVFTRILTKRKTQAEKTKSMEMQHSKSY